MTNPNSTHLFISYAVEDATRARWLARKLAARAHRVWFDQMKLRGGSPLEMSPAILWGEPWPQTID